MRAQLYPGHVAARRLTTQRRDAVREGGREGGGRPSGFARNTSSRMGSNGGTAQCRLMPFTKSRGVSSSIEPHLLAAKHRSCKGERGNYSPFRTAVPLCGQNTQILSSLPRKRDCGPKRVNNRPAVERDPPRASAYAIGGSRRASFIAESARSHAGVLYTGDT